MSDSKQKTNLQKGARVINAAIAELELPDELKLSAQQVVTMFATDLLPGLWPRREAQPTRESRPDPGEASSADETEILASLRRVVRSVTRMDEDDDEVRPRRASCPERASMPWDDRELKLVEVALVTLRCAYQNQLSQLEGAILSAMNRGVDSLDVLDLLLAAQDYRNADPALPALLALAPTGPKTDLH